MNIIEEVKYRVIETSEIDKIISINLEISNNKDKQMHYVHRSLKNHLTNNRVRRANTKTRSEVRGGGKKPWKQKGTGKARAGSTRSPLWRGGGVIFGPIYKHYKSKINRKEKRLAINTILYNKSKHVICINEKVINNEIPKTKNAILNLKQLGINITENRRILIIVENKTNTTNMSFRNLAYVELIEIKHINILSLLKSDLILISTQAIKTLNVK